MMGLTEEDLRVPGIGLQIGVEPGRIDVLTAVSGVRFEDAWPGRIHADFGEAVRCTVIGLSELLQIRWPTWVTDCSACGVSWVASLA